MASILILSIHGDGIPIALRLVDEGHIVKLWFKNAEAKGLLEGSKNPSKVSNPKALYDQYDFIIADSCGLGQLCEEFVEKDKAVIGGGLFNDKLMGDLKYQTRVVKTLTKIGLDITDGISLTVEGWFNGKEFVRPFNYSFSNQRLMNNSVGPLTPCMGNVVLPISGNKLINETVEVLQPLLEKVNYTGPMGINLLVREQEICFKSFKPSFNYDVIQSWFELIQIPLFNYFYNLIDRKKTEIPFHNEYAMSVRLTIPPYPYEGNLMSIKIPVHEEAKKHVWLAEANNVVGCVTARGVSVRECQRRAYRTIKNLKMDQSVQYRTDVGQGVEQNIESLKSWGWL